LQKDNSLKNANDKKPEDINGKTIKEKPKK